MADHASIFVEAQGMWRITAGTFASNCYAVATTTPGCCVLVDPGLGGEEIKTILQQLALRPLAVLCTHGHFDHGGSASLFQHEHGCPVYLHAEDVKTLKASNFLLMAFKIDQRIEQPELSLIGTGQQIVEFDGCRFEFYAAPGHTPGSCVIGFRKHLFTGDTLYARGVGLSKLPGEKPEQLRASLLEIFERFGPDVEVHPGHGESAPLAWVRDNNLPLRRFLEASASTITDQ